MGVVQLRNFKRVNEDNQKKAFKNKVIQLRDLNSLQDDTWEWFVQMGFIDGNIMPERNYENVNNALKNKAVAVIGSGYSGRGLKWAALKKMYTIGVNHVIELYHDLDYLIFQDHRFLRINKYPLGEYKGSMFVANSNPAVKRCRVKNIYPFVPIGLKNEVSTRIEKGLYARKSTGLCALNLAIILGANPIYLIGLDNAKNWESQFPKYNGGIHIHKNYTGGVNSLEAAKGYLPVLKYYKKFLPYKNRIINVCENGIMDWFKRISMTEFNRRLEGHNKNKVLKDAAKLSNKNEDKVARLNG